MMDYFWLFILSYLIIFVPFLYIRIATIWISCQYGHKGIEKTSN